MNKQHCTLIPGEFYHLFNHAVGSEKLFRSEENNGYFLSKMKQHILPVADLFAYSLLPNHFHLLVRVKPAETIQSLYEVKKENHLMKNNMIFRIL